MQTSQQKIITGALAVALVAVIGAGVAAMASEENKFGFGDKKTKMIERIQEKNPDLTLPENFTEMTKEEVKTFLSENGIERPDHGKCGEHRGGKFMKNMDKPDNWTDMTQEEKKDFMKSKAVERLQKNHPDLVLPENFTEMTKEEVKTFLSENGIERPDHGKHRRGKHNRNQSETRGEK